MNLKEGQVNEFEEFADELRDFWNIDQLNTQYLMHPIMNEFKFERSQKFNSWINFPIYHQNPIEESKIDKFHHETVSLSGRKFNTK